MAFLFVDSSGGVFQTDLQNGTTRQLADYNLSWTDIAITSDGRVFATTFSGLYLLDLETAEATLLVNLTSNANGLEAGADDALYVSFASDDRIDVLSSEDYTLLESIDLPRGATSAGDVLIEGDNLYLSTNSRQLLTLDLETNEQVDAVSHSLFSLFGLQYEDGTLFALSGRDVYEMDPVTGDTELVDALPISGTVYGAASLAGVVIEGTNKRDILTADIGGSTMLGFKGHDVLIGDQGKDILEGHAGRDILLGEGGNDRLFGGSGRDELIGGQGKDVLHGGSGADLFVFFKKDGQDVIRDFEAGRDDLEIEASMMGRGAKTVERLLENFAEDTGADVVLDFGRKGKITLQNVDAIEEIADDILIF